MFVKYNVLKKNSKKNVDLVWGYISNIYTSVGVQYHEYWYKRVFAKNGINHPMVNIVHWFSVKQAFWKGLDQVVNVLNQSG